MDKQESVCVWVSVSKVENNEKNATIRTENMYNIYCRNIEWIDRRDGIDGNIHSTLTRAMFFLSYVYNL